MEETADVFPTIDPIVAWPGNARRLRDDITAMQHRNPALALRCVRGRSASSASIGDEHLDDDDDGSEYLVFAGSAKDVITIAMPDPPSDDMLSGFTDLNREQRPLRTDHGLFHLGPRRIERTAAGDLLIRPRTEAVAIAASRFARRWHHDNADRDAFVVQGRWGILRDPFELWEVDFAVLPGDVFARARDDATLWRTTPIGTITYVDEHDIPFAEHLERARAIVALGAAFAIVGDIVRGEMHVVRASSEERVAGDVVVPELPHLRIPAPRDGQG